MSTEPLGGVVLPVSAPASLHVPDGDPAGLDALAGIVLEAAGRYDELSQESRELNRIGGWTGESRDRYVATARSAVTRAEAMSDTLRRTGRAMLACADRLRHHQRTHQELVARRSELDGRLERLAAEIAAGIGVTPEQAAGLQERADGLARSYRVLVVDDEELRGRVRSNEELLRQVMESATDRDGVTAVDGGRPEAAVRAMERAGSPRAAAGSPAQVRRWWEELTWAERRAVVASYSQVIADAEGVPELVRQRAARIAGEETAVWLQRRTDDGTASPGEASRLARTGR